MSPNPAVPADSAAPDRAGWPAAAGQAGSASAGAAGMAAASEPVYYGLPLSVWLKIIATSALLAALFRFNLARLWLKTNPFNGQSANWEHSMILPLIGLYYLYVWRDDLLQPRRHATSRAGDSRDSQAEEPLRRLLATWLMLAITAWGLAFFVAVLRQRAFEVLRPTLATVTVVSLAAAVAFWNQPQVRAWGARLYAASAGWFGGFVMAFGILFSFWGIWPGQNDFFKDVGMVIALFGVVTLLGGWRVMKVAWFPIAFLLCGMPWPDQYYSRLAMPLQHLAAQAAVRVLNTGGVEALCAQGTKIVMAGSGGQVRTLNVAEACAGMRSLMTFISVAAAVAFLSARPLWQKVFITASAVPIAILCNVMRVSGQGLLDFYVSEQWSTGFAHHFAGLVMLVPGFFLILGVCWLLDHLFIEVADDADRLQQLRRVPVPAKVAAKAPVAVAGMSAVGADVAAATPARGAGNDARVIQIPRRLAAGSESATRHAAGHGGLPTEDQR